MFYQTVRGAYANRDRYPLTAEEIAAIPYSTMGFWAKGNPRAIVVMETLQPPDRATWRAADRVLIVTDNGAVVETAGMPRDLRRYEYGGMPVLTLDALRSLGNRPVRGSVDLGAPLEFGIPFESQFEIGQTTALMILDKTYDVIPVTEQVRFTTKRWKTTNRYWFRASDGLVIKGERGYSEDMQALQWERFAHPLQAS